jgi:hypothetical protein
MPGIQETASHQERYDAPSRAFALKSASVDGFPHCCPLGWLPWCQRRTLDTPEAVTVIHTTRR